ncbi:MAG TPA: hypothetical protein VK858_10435 [Longimicrobiales bacterium]|nr:hypothetical protein [Longimicrobiales bacterium]
MTDGWGRRGLFSLRTLSDSLPALGRLVWASPGEVVLLVRDDLDVEHVRVHRVAGL